MKCKRLLTVGLMALLCAGTATAASQLNSVQVTPKANTATVSLRTTGSFAHKEYRPDEHSVLVDLTGVTADPSVERTIAVSSPVLKGYKLTSYTSGSGSEVTRLELTLGDGVTVEVNDKGDGLQILLNSRGSNISASTAEVSSVASSFPSASTPSAPTGSTVAAPKPAVGDAAAKLFHPVPADVPATKKVGTPQAAQVVAPVPPAALAPVRTAQRSAEPSAAIGVLTPTTIRNISVQRGHGTLDIVIEGPNNAHPFPLKNPDRLVLDFSNAITRPSVRNIAVHTRDVLQVRVSRFQAEPPVTRIVIDLSGPRSFEVVPSATQVTVRVTAEDVGMVGPALKVNPAQTLASVEAPALRAAQAPVLAPAAPALKATPVPLLASVAAPPLKAVPISLLAPAQAQVLKAAPVPMLASAPMLKAAPAPLLAPAAPALKATPATLLASVAAPALKAVPISLLAPAQAQAIKTAPVPMLASAPMLKAAPLPVLAPAAPALKAVPLPVLASIAAPAFKAVPAPILAFEEAPVLAAPIPTLASAEAPAVAGQLALGGSSLQNSRGARAALASATLNPRTRDVALPAVSRASRIRAAQSRDPKVRASSAAEKMATIQQGSQAPVEMAQLNPPAPEQLSRNAARSSSSTSKYTGEPISVNLKDVDLKDFFRLIHEISGLNIVLDPNVKGSVTLVLDDVPWDQALDIVLKNNALDRELQGNVLRIAATDTLRREAVDRRAQSEAVALAVDRQTISRFLSYAKAKEIVPTIKKFLTARGDVISDERTNALIISDIPSVIPDLDHLISQLDRKSQEVEIEVRVVSATRSFSRDLGFQLGFNWGNGVSTIGGSNPNGSTIGGGTTGAGTGTISSTGAASGTLPLFSNFPVSGATTGLSLSNITKSYGIDAILTAAETHNLAKVLSRPRVVTQSNVKAEVKQGVKLPVYTAATQNANASVSYIDAVLRLSVTPQITSDNTIFLTVDVENTQPSGTINSNYILTTQQATTQVLVTDGGTVVIGGVIQTTNTVSTSQTPLLGDIPWLGNLFKQRLVKTETDELIFFITPKIIQT